MLLCNKLFLINNLFNLMRRSVQLFSRCKRISSLACAMFVFDATQFKLKCQPVESSQNVTIANIQMHTSVQWLCTVVHLSCPNRNIYSTLDSNKIMRLLFAGISLSVDIYFVTECRIICRNKESIAVHSVLHTVLGMYEIQTVEIKLLVATTP